ncbi:MAG: hypothetical protein GXN99_01080 [Candidatus Nanohaloarchaeota archaeon]|nr:hypothetical protein [Candidatus Nanohaloarchaeota archaeon]
MVERENSKSNLPPAEGKDLEDARKKLEEKEAEEMKNKDEAFKERVNVVERFAMELVKKFKKSVKSVVLYGSTTTGKFHEKSDIDVFIIIDDTEFPQEPSPGLKDSIWRDLLDIASKVDKRITVQSYMFLTEFWENVRMVEPVVLAILRNGLAVYDVGVFMPAKRMLERGLISLTREAIDKKITAAPEFVKMAYGKLKSPGHYIEQAMAYAGNAALMSFGEYPTNKELVPEMLEKVFAKKGLLEMRYVKMARDIHLFAKEMEHIGDKEAAERAGEIGKHVIMADEFVQRMDKLIKELGKRDKGANLMENYKTLLKANVMALKLLNIMPPERLEDLPKEMNKAFPKLAMLHNEVFDKLTDLLMKIKEGKEAEIDEEEIKRIEKRLQEYLEKLREELKDLKKKGKIKEDIPKFI